MTLRASLTGPLAWALALAPGALLAAPAVYEASPKPRAAMFLSYGSAGQVETGDTSEVLEAFDQVLAERTRLVRSRLPSSYVAKCNERFTVLDLCVFETLFPGLGLTDPSASAMDPEAAAEAVRREADAPRLVFNVSLAIDREGRKVARFRVFSSTTAAAVLARAHAEAARAGRLPDPRDLQGALARRAVKRFTQEDVARLADPRLFRDAFDALSGLLAAYPPRAVLELPGARAPEGAVVALDGAELGPIPPEGATITDVPEGLHTVRVTAPGYDPAEIPLTVGVRERRVVEYRLASRAGRLGRQITLWTGIGVAALGAGAMVWAAATGGERSCLRIPVAGEQDPPSAADYCPGGTQAGTGDPGPQVFDPDGGEPPGAGLLRKGPPMISLGGALLGAGASWTLGALLWGEDDEVPWIPILIGVVVGGAIASTAAL